MACGTTRCPLFPYTTLFRSPHILPGALLVAELELLGGVELIGRHAGGIDRGLQEIDRKSTRLNSSHVATSYAVFCLKKIKGMRHDEKADLFPLELTLAQAAP